MGPLRGMGGDKTPSTTKKKEVYQLKKLPKLETLSSRGGGVPGP